MTQTNKAIEEKGFQRLKEDIPFRYLGVTRCILHDTLLEQQKQHEEEIKQWKERKNNAISNGLKAVKINGEVIKDLQKENQDLKEQQKYYEHQQVCLLQREQKQHEEEIKKIIYILEEETESEDHGVWFPKLMDKIKEMVK